MEVFRGECNFSQSSWVKRKGRSSTGGGGGTDITGKQVNAIAQSMKSIQIEQKSTIIDNHKNECDRFLTIFDICRLINIDFIDYYRFLWSIEIIDL